MASKKPVKDEKFEKYCQQNLRSGDKTNLCKLLNVSYPTIRQYLKGEGQKAYIRSRIVEYFKIRAENERRLNNYLSEQLEKQANFSEAV